MDAILSHPSPMLFYGLLICTTILGLVFLATIFIGLRRMQAGRSVDAQTSRPTTNAAAASGPELLGSLQSAVALLQAQEPGSAGYNRQLGQVRLLLDESSRRYPSSSAKVQAWKQQLMQGGEGPNLLILTEIHGWTRQLLRGPA